jgi:hypothetical protein
MLSAHAAKQEQLLFGVDRERFAARGRLQHGDLKVKVGQIISDIFGRAGVVELLIRDVIFRSLDHRVLQRVFGRRNKRRRHLAAGSRHPVDAGEKGMVFDLLGACRSLVVLSVAESLSKRKIVQGKVSIQP